MHVKSVALLALLTTASAVPINLTKPNPNAEWKALKPSTTGHAMSLKRSTMNCPDAHLALVKKANKAHKRHAKKLNGAPRDYKRSIEAVKNPRWVPLETAIEEAKRAKRRSNRRSQGTEVTQSFTPASTPAQGDSIAVDEDGHDATYFSQITIGSNNKLFTVVMDTGSSDLWVPAAGSTTTHSTLGSSDSSTLQISNTPYQIQYGTGNVAGVLVADTVGFGGFNLNTTFGASTFVSSDFDPLIPDGIMGLATTQASAEGVEVPLQKLKDQGSIPNALIGVHLQRENGAPDTNDGVINFGTIDPSFIVGGSNSLVFSDNVSQEGLWEVPLQGMTVNGQNLDLDPSSTSIIDTGTTLLLMPVDQATALHQALGVDVQTDGQGNFAFPCDTNAPITAQFAGQSFTISPSDYVGEPVQNGSNTCVSNIMGAQIGGPTQSLFGDVWLKNVYAVFDLDNNQVGFGVDAVNAQGNASAAATPAPAAAAAPPAATPQQGGNTGAAGGNGEEGEGEGEGEGEAENGGEQAEQGNGGDGFANSVESEIASAFGFARE